MRDELFIFCNRQLHASNLLIRLHVIKQDDLKGAHNPFTDKVDFMIQDFEAPKFICTFSQWLIEKMITEDGEAVRDRYLNLGLLEKIE